MPARIFAIRTDEPEKILPIERMSNRVGGAAPSDIIINGLPPHVFSLEFLDDSYWILNTGNETLYLDENVIPRGSQMAWDPGEVLQVDKGLMLQLEINGDPAPKLQQRTLLGIRPKELLTGDELAARNHQLKLSAVLAMTVFGILIVSYQIVFSNSDPDRRVRAELNEILMQLDDRLVSFPDLPVQRNSRDEIKDLSDALKRARVAELDREPEKALSKYGAIRNHVRERYRTDGEEFIDPVFQQVHEFVWSREQANGLVLNKKVK